MQSFHPKWTNNDWVVEMLNLVPISSPGVKLLVKTVLLCNFLALVYSLNYPSLRNTTWATRIDASYVNKHWLWHKLYGNSLKKDGDEHIPARLSNQDEVIHLDNRILHCPPDSENVVETQHDESKHIISNYAIKSVVFSLVIVSGLVCNIITLSVLQHFEVSPMKAAMRSEAVATTAYLLLLIPLYPLANLSVHTGTFQTYEAAKPYITSFFQACLDITEFLYIWMFVWLNKLRNTLVVNFNSQKAEKCTAKSTRDELRLMTCLGIIVNLPKFFDSQVTSESDPCHPGELIVVREPNVLGKHSAYIVLYQVFLLSLIYYIMPFIWLAIITYSTHSSLNNVELAEGETKQSIMRERYKTDEAMTTELDKRIFMFYILLLPGAFFQIAKHIQYLLPQDNNGYDAAAEAAEVITTLLSTLHAAFAAFITYMVWHEVFREKVANQYWKKLRGIYRQYLRRMEHKKDFDKLEKRLAEEALNKTKVVGYTESRI